MPIFEFVCQSCSAAFEEIVKPDVAVSCPKCGSGETFKQLSSFSVPSVSSSIGTAQGGPVTGPCGSCGHPNGPGGCRLED